MADKQKKPAQKGQNKSSGEAKKKTSSQGKNKSAAQAKNKSAEEQKKPTKTLAIVTYGISLLCLVLGLLLPFGPVQAEGYNAIIMQIPKALGCFGVEMDGADLTYTFPINFWGAENAFDLGGFFVLLYVLVTVISVGMLFAVIFGNKEKDTSVKCASVMEVISSIVLSVLLLSELTMVSTLGYEAYNISISLAIAFGGPLLMLFIQSIATKGSSGAAKMILTILALITVVFCFYPLNMVIPSLGEAMDSIFKGNFNLLDWSKDGVALGSLWAQVSMPFSANYGDFLGALGDGMGAAVCVMMLLLGIVMIVNLFFDIGGLAKKTERWMLLANLIRYGLELLLVVLVLILGGAVGKHSIGVACYLLLTLAIVLTAVNVIRFITFKEEEKEEEKAEDEKEEKQEKPAQKPAQPAQQPAQPAPVAAEAPVEENVPYEEGYAPYTDEQQPQPEQQQPYTQGQPQPQQPYNPTTTAPAAMQEGNIYSPVIYNGPHDEFIDSLNNDQRVEFAKTFLERRSGNLYGIPEYVVEGENDKFFQSLFIYYARIRGLVSDGLMNKFYEQVSAIKR